MVDMSATNESGSGAPAKTQALKRAVFFGVILVWLAIDVSVKSLLVHTPEGTVLYESPFKFIDIVVAHNTGGAWSIFAGAPVMLGFFSLVVCAVIAIGVFAFSERLSLLSCIAAGLVCAGGLGNVIDRFVRGYVIDYLATAFISFPVFNIADIGVTVGMALLIVSLWLTDRKSSHTEKESCHGPSH